MNGFPVDSHRSLTVASLLNRAARRFSDQLRRTPAARCVALRHHGDPDARNCYESLTRSRDPGVQAEGYWGIRDYKAANEAFKRP